MKEDGFNSADIRQGECLWVLSVSGEGAVRLFDLGFFSGARIRCVGIAPFGDPVMITVGGRVVALRRRDLAYVSAAQEEK